MRLLLFFVAILTMAASADELGPIEPASNGGQVIRSGQYQYIHTPSGIGWDQFDQVLARQDWQTPDADTLNASGPGAVWLRIPLAAPLSGQKDWRLEVRWPHLSSVAMATWTESDGLGDVLHAGKSVPLTELEIVDKNIVFPFELSGQSQTTLYLRVAESRFAYLPLMLFSEQDYDNHTLVRVVLFSMAFGIMAVMILYNLSLYFAVTDKMYLFYSNTVLSSLLYILAVSGYGRVVFWADNPWLDDHASSLFAAYCFLSVTYFSRVFLDLKRYGGWILTANTLMLVSYAIALVATATPYASYGVVLLGVIAGLNGPVALATVVVVWWKGNASAKYFILAWFGVGISTTYMVATLRGKIDYFPALEYSQAASFVLEIVLLSLALADRIRRQRVAKEVAQASLLRLQEKTNKELEAQVAARTQELESAMADLKTANTELAKLTKLDPLTNVNNRRQFDEIAEREIARAQRSNEPLTIMMVDIDHFKAINDNYGHLVGDQCIKLVAQCLVTNLRGPSDLVARYGGEEFVYVLPGSDETNALKIAARAREAVEHIHHVHKNEKVSLTVSCGVAAWIPDTENAYKDLLNAADAALYRAKKAGRNCVMAAGRGNAVETD